jgi:beta-N-acetylhexosaminidase
MRAFITGLAGTELSAEERAFLRDAQPWGFILFTRNVADPGQLRGLIEDARATLGRFAPVLIDQEGGRVQRLGPPHWPAYPPGAAYGALYDRDRDTGLAAARLGNRLIAADLAALGIDVDCLPIADVPIRGADPVVGDRAYGTEPAKVAAIAGAVAAGLAQGGVLPVLKHIPGHGRATADSHAGLPVVNADRTALEATDFAAFRPLAALPLAMTAHVVFTAIDPIAPATVSATIVRDVIRDSIGFKGLLMSDDISMGALSGSIAARTRAAIAAGCDVVLHCNGEMAEMRAVAAEVPRLDSEAKRRAETALAAKKPAAPIDLAASRAEFLGLMTGAWQPAERYA